MAEEALIDALLSAISPLPGEEWTSTNLQCICGNLQGAIEAAGLKKETALAAAEIIGILLTADSTNFSLGINKLLHSRKRTNVHVSVAVLKPSVS